MKALKWIFAGAVFSFSTIVSAAQPDSVIVTHYEPLHGLSIEAADASVSQKVSGSGSATLGFGALGQDFSFELVPNAGFLSAASREALPDGIAIYRGEIAGNPDSWARFVVFDGMPRGMFFDGQDMYAVEAPGDSIVGANFPVIYRLADMFIQAGAMSCGSESLSGNGATVFQKLAGELSSAVQQGPGAVSEITIGAVGDYEFTNAQGGDAAAAAAITARLNMVDGIYSQEIGVQIVVPVIDTFSDPADPFTDETDAGRFLDEVAAYRQNTTDQRNQGLTHLYTGRDLDGTTVGIAYNGVLCRTNVGAGLSEGNGSASFDSLVAAHEIGHNFGAPHDGVPGACESEPQNFIMAPMQNGSTQFSQCSIGIMQASAAAASCVSALPTVDMAVVLSGQAANVFLGNSPQLTIDLNNNGASQATNVVLDVTLPNNVSFVSATASAGTCTDGAGTVNCQIGDVPGQTTTTVTLTTTASAVGVGTFNATVSSDTDERPANNLDSVLLNVNPAVDLVINAPATSTVNLDQSTTVSTTLENLSVLDATGVTLSISLTNGMRAESATWSIGTCTVTPNQVDCVTPIFAAQSSSNFSLGITGLNAGNRSYNVTLSSLEADADNSNNSVSGMISIVDPDAEDSGGAFGLPFLGLLGLMLFARRRLD